MPFFLYICRMRETLSDIALYHEYKATTDTNSLLSERTWEDLNLDDFFLFADHTSSCIGRQYLYDVLHYNRTSEVAGQEKILDSLSADTVLRRDIQNELKKLNHVDACSIASLFSATHPVSSRSFYLLLRILQFIPALSLGLLYVTSSVGFLWLMLAGLLVNLVLHYRKKTEMQAYLFSVPQLLNLLKQSEKLTKRPLCLSINKEITEVLSDLMPLRKRLASFRLSIRLESDLAFMVYLFTELFNMFFLTEAISASRAFFLLQGKQQKLEQVFRFFGLIDVLCSVSEFRSKLPYYSLPESCPEEISFQVEDIYHPLIENCVPNTITLYAKSALITGSNMSGKTSFIRSIGVNLLSAGALHTCFAHHFCSSSDLKLASAIHMEDSLMEGKSFFLQEVQTVKEMIDLSGEGNHLFLLDELFKGTNTIERIAIAKAVLSALVVQRNLVFISTHDIELASLLRAEYDLYHFCESVEDGVLSFDYKLKSGPVTERNAIRILDICGYPQEVIQEAYGVVGRISAL